MRRILLLLVLAAGISTSMLSTPVSAGQPFDLFSSLSNPCDASGCDSDSCCDTRDCKRCSYCSVYGGWNNVNTYSGEAEVPAPAPRLQGTFNDGWGIGLAKGRRFDRGIRGEFEFAFRSNTADMWSVNGAAADYSGHLYSYAAMANLYKDCPDFELAGITPYLGAGIGLAIVDGDFQTSLTRVEIEDAAFAYQFMLGGSKQLHRGVELFTEYRFFGTTGVKLVNIGAAPNVDFGNHELESDNILFGLRINR